VTASAIGRRELEAGLPRSVDVLLLLLAPDRAADGSRRCPAAGRSAGLGPPSRASNDRGQNLLARLQEGRSAFFDLRFRSSHRGIKAASE